MWISVGGKRPDLPRFAQSDLAFYADHDDDDRHDLIFGVPQALCG
jgi:hypothetical protein